MNRIIQAWGSTNTNIRKNGAPGYQQQMHLL